jgi:hypothetical protein
MSDEGLIPVPDDLDFGQTIKGFVPRQKLFGRYALDRLIGRGGMGMVWLAQDEKLDQWVALKFLPETLRLDSSALDDLKRETRRGLALAHPHIVRIYDFVDDSNSAAISMEYIDGRTLAAMRVEQESRVYEASQLEQWMTQAVEALDYAHRRGKIVHRDLKPANLMTTQAGDLKVADFGIARSISDSVSRVSVRGASSGTLVYMSPQQAQGQAPKPSDDIYSLGATIYELMTSKPPFFSGNIQHQLDTVTAPSMAERRAELELEAGPIPEEWEQTVAACLAKDPADRPQNIAQLGEMLGLRAATAPSTPAVPLIPKTTIRVASGPPTEPVPPPRKSWLVPALAGGAVLLLLAGGLGYYFGVVAPAEREKQEQIAQQATVAKAAADEQARIALEKAKADQAALEQAAQAKSDEEKTAILKAQQEADVRAAAAEQAAKDAQAAALQAQQALATRPSTPPPAPMPPVVSPEEIARENDAIHGQIQPLVDSGKNGLAAYHLEQATKGMDATRAAAITALFQDKLGPYKQQRDAAITASQNGDPAAALDGLKTFSQQNPNDPRIEMANASVVTRMPPTHDGIKGELKQMSALSSTDATVRGDTDFQSLQSKLANELTQLDALSSQLDHLKASTKHHTSLSTLESRRAAAEQKLANYKLIPPTSFLYSTVASSIADKEREIDQLTEEINEAKSQTPASQGDIDAAQQKYDAFLAAVPW